MGEAREEVVLTLDIPAQAEYLVGVRRQIECVAKQTSLSQTQVEDFLTAVDEAVANAIRHGSPNREQSRIAVSCSRLPHGLIVEIQDEGTGAEFPNAPTMPLPHEIGGRGLPLMMALADTVEIIPSEQGTRVKVAKFA